MEIHNTNNTFTTQSSSAFPTNGQQPVEGQDKIQQSENKTTDAIMTDLIDLLSDNLGIDLLNKTGVNTETSTDPTSLSNTLILPEDQAILDNLDKLLAILQMETSEEQLKMAQERISLLKDQIEARCQDQLEQIAESCEKLQEQLKEQKAARALTWLTAIFAVFLAVATILTGGATAPLMALAVIGAVGAVANAICSELDVGEKIAESLKNHYIKKGMSPKEAQEKAQTSMMIITGVSLAVTLAVSITCACCGNVSALQQGLSALNKIAMGVKVGTTVMQGLVGIGSAINTGISAKTNYDMSMAQVQLLQIKKILERLEEMMDDEQDSLKEITQMLQSNVNVLRNLIESEAEITDNISDNMGTMQI